MLTGSAKLSRALATDYGSADISSADRAMLDYAVLLTRDPAAVAAESVEQLREAGFDDTAILDMCQIVSYYNYVNRLADGLGVELEDYWQDDALTMTHSEVAEARVARRSDSSIGDDR